MISSILLLNQNRGYNKLSKREKLKDFNYMYKILEENYPFFEVNKRLTGVDWLSNKDRYIDMITQTSNDEDYYEVLTEILSELHNHHTNMIDSEMFIQLRGLYGETDARYKEWTKQLNNPLAIKRYLKEEQSNINNLDKSNKIKSNNVYPKVIKKDKIAYLSIYTLNLYNIESDMQIIKPFISEIKEYVALIIDIRGNGGGASSYWSDYLVPMLIDTPLIDTVYGVYRGGEFIESFIKSFDGGGYEALLDIQEIKEYQLKNLPPEIMNDFKYYTKLDRVIEPDNDDLNFNGDIYLLVDDGVYSSSEMFASFAKHTGFAILVGEKTSGDGIGSDPAICILPNSGYAFSFSKEMGLTADGTCNEEFKTEPDIEVKAKRNPDIDRDRVVQKVIELIEY